MAIDQTTAGASFTRRFVLQLTGAAAALPSAPHYSNRLENPRMSFTPKFVDLVRNTTTTQGTGNFVLGPAATGFTSIAVALQPGDSFYYSAIGVDKPAEREVGRGTLQSNGTVSRDPIGGTLTNFSNGTKTIALVASAEWYAQVQGGNAVSRAALAASSHGQAAVMLCEQGREGIFAWDASDHSASVSADAQQGLYVSPASDPSGKSGAWVRKFSGAVNVKWFGAIGDGSANDAAAFIGALAALKSFAENPSGAGFYKGSPKLFIPAGHYFMGTTPLDISHTLIIEGEGSGRFGPGGGGCTRLRWSDGTSGIRIQSATTSGNSALDSVTHDGSGGVVLRQLMIQGGYAGTEGDCHGLVCRNATTGEDLYVHNWPGEGIKGWAGNVIGYGNVAGNFSVSCFKSVRIEGCRIGSDVRGSDANLVTYINCEAYQNRQAGFVDDNGAGSNTYIGCHAASNGLISGTTPTQCTQAGNHYAATWTGTLTNPPSGTTADTADWLYIEAGGTDVTRPAWTATPGTFRPGGDYVTLNSAGVVFYNCYSEGGGFSQLIANTRMDEGTIGDPYCRGGIRTNSRSDGWRLRQHPNATMLLEHRSTQAAIAAQDESAVVHSMIVLSKTAGNDHFARDVTGHRFFTAPYRGSWTLRGSITTSGLELPAGAAITNNGQQVVGARQTGTPADATDLASALTLINAMKAKLIAHGLIA